jgi:hypothetical protein
VPFEASRGIRGWQHRGQGRGEEVAAIIVTAIGRKARSSHKGLRLAGVAERRELPARVLENQAGDRRKRE